jgi:hypothetical protein
LRLRLRIAAAGLAAAMWAQNKPTPSAPGTRIVRVATVTWPGGKPHVA